MNAFGAFTPSLGTGLYHIANDSLTSGIKLWTYGMADDSAWSVLSTARHQRYIEIQGGPLGDQSVKLELKGGATRWHEEYWYPTDKELDIHTLLLPHLRLRPIREVPLFGWARKEEVEVWTELVDAFKRKSKIPAAPAVEDNRWAPSGMEDLDAAFQWAVQRAALSEADVWKFHYGSWLAGRGDTARAVSVLLGVQNGLGKVLLARLLKLKGDVAGARKAFASVTEPWLLIHPQVVVERDKVLRSAGMETVTEREAWLAKVDALKDEWVIERKVQLLIDKGEYEKARTLLMGTAFQKVHQTYTRTGLWMQICEKLRVACDPIPTQLGEDRLARFGSYREFE